MGTFYGAGINFTANCASSWHMVDIGILIDILDILKGSLID